MVRHGRRDENTMDHQVRALVFFDIGGTLATVTLGPGGASIAALDVFPEVPEVLGRLRDRGVRLGIISDPGPIPTSEVDRALRDAGIATSFDPDLVIYGAKRSPAIFRLASTRSRPGGTLLFVGENDEERSHAVHAGFLVRSSPSLALDLLNGRHADS